MFPSTGLEQMNSHYMMRQYVRGAVARRRVNVSSRQHANVTWQSKKIPFFAKKVFAVDLHIRYFSTYTKMFPSAVYGTELKTASSIQVRGVLFELLPIRLMDRHLVTGQSKSQSRKYFSLHRIWCQCRSSLWENEVPITLFLLGLGFA